MHAPAAKAVASAQHAAAPTASQWLLQAGAAAAMLAPRPQHTTLTGSPARTHGSMQVGTGRSTKLGRTVVSPQAAHAEHALCTHARTRAGAHARF